MCGIVGVCSSFITQAKIEEMSEALRHRGPDAGGTWASECCDVMLGHRRLAIIDLSENGSQPMVFADDGMAIVYNGEIYNFQSIRDDLVQAGTSFRGHSDTEVLLAAYRHWGEKAFSRLSGMFSFAILDEKRQKLFLVRDRCGQKPLYYIDEPYQFAFASEVKALHVLKPELSTIDPRGLADYLAYGYALGPHTLTAGVSKLLPGEMLCYDLCSGGIQKEKYWTVPYQEQKMLKPVEAETAFENLLENAVGRHLVSDVPVGLLLSGGIDSSLITAIASRSGQALRTFSVVFPDQVDRDESLYAAAVAEHFGAEHTELEMESMSSEILIELARFFDDPIADHAVVPMYLLSKTVRQHVKVALSGDGGDELFGGYPHYGLISYQASLRRIPSVARSLIAFGADRIPPGVRGRNHLVGMRGSIDNAIAHINMLFDARQRAGLLGSSDGAQPEQRKIDLVSGEPRNVEEKAMYCDFLTTMAEGYLMKVDRAAMAASLEIRAPLLDNSIVDFAWSNVAENLKYFDGKDKILPRRLAARLLPEAIADKPKKGLTMPLNEWLKNGQNPFLQEVLLDTSQTLFDRKAVRRLFNEQSRGRNNATRIFALTMLVLWANEYGMSRG